MEPSDYEDERRVQSFIGEIEHEDEKRRTTTSLGYKLDGWWSALFSYIPAALMVQVVVIMVTAIIGLPRGAADNPWWLLLFLPMATIPVYPFFVLKFRYAGKALAIMAAFLGVIILLGAFAFRVMGLLI